MCVLAGMGFVQTERVVTHYFEDRPFYYGAEGAYYVQVTSNPQPTVTRDGVMTMVDGTVEGLDIDKNSTTEHVKANGNIRIYVPGEPDIHMGDRYIIRGTVKGFTYYEQSGALSMKTRHINDGLQGNLYQGTIEGTYAVERTLGAQLTDSGYAIGAYLDRVHHWVAQQFEKNLDPSIATLGSSLVLGGQYALLPETMVKLFSETGLIHILSVSGSHIALLFLIISTMLQRFQLPKGVEFSITCALILLYCTIVGWSPPVLRSAMMGLLSGYVVMHGGTYRALHALLLSALCLLLWKPLFAVDISFVLSFGSTLGIIGLYPYVYRLFPPNPISKGVALCISAQVLIFPIELYYFHILSFLSILSNLIVGPLLDLAIIGGLGLSVLNTVFTFSLGWSLLGFILKASMSLLFAIRNLGLLWSPPMPMWLLVVWYGGIAYVYWLLALKEPIHVAWNRGASIALLLIGMLPWGLSYVKPTVQVIPVAVSSGPTFMVCKSGFHREAYLYIDAKNGDLSPRAMKQCVDALHHQGFSKWNGIFVEGYQKGFTNVDTLEHLYSQGQADAELTRDWLSVQLHAKSGYEIIVKGQRNFHFHPRKEEKLHEIVYNTKRETNTIYGLTESHQLLEYQEQGATQFIVWNTLHSQFDVEDGVYIVGSDEDNIVTL
jgi:ComEC/Rec2-like protein